MGSFPLYSSVEALLSGLVEYFDGDNANYVRQMVLAGSPFSVILIFATNGKFGDEFDAATVVPGCNFKVKRRLIRWHLEAVLRAFDSSQPVIGMVMGKKYEADWEWGEREGFENSQLKLGYSLGSFLLHHADRGITECIEAGSGVGQGGKNHDFVGELLAMRGQTMTLKMYDPAATSGKRTTGGLTCDVVRGAVTQQMKFIEPVFYDIYDGGFWQKLQKSGYPNMTKHLVNGIVLDSMCAQPYHQEMRSFRHRFLYWYIQASLETSAHFCHCRDCTFWKSLSREFLLEQHQLLSILLRYGYPSCVSSHTRFITGMYDVSQMRTTGIKEENVKLWSNAKVKTKHNNKYQVSKKKFGLKSGLDVSVTKEFNAAMRLLPKNSLLLSSIQTTVRTDYPIIDVKDMSVDIFRYSAVCVFDIISILESFVVIPGFKDVLFVYVNHDNAITSQVLGAFMQSLGYQFLFSQQVENDIFDQEVKYLMFSRTIVRQYTPELLDWYMRLYQVHKILFFPTGFLFAYDYYVYYGFCSAHVSEGGVLDYRDIMKLNEVFQPDRFSRIVFFLYSAGLVNLVSVPSDAERGLYEDFIRGYSLVNCKDDPVVLKTKFFSRLV
jgi:hypothetical protein